MTNMPRFRWLTPGAACLLAATAVMPQQQPPAESAPPQFRTSVEVVITPVTVTDRDGNYVSGLQPYQFHLTDNDKEQDIHVDVTFQPISLVVAIQANAHVESILPQIRPIGKLLEPLVVGDQGEVAVVAFDHRYEVKQPFTSDPTRIADAVKKITAGSSTSAMVDAVMNSVRLLSTRPKDRRRILLLISETRDMGSEGKKRDALIAAQINNVEVYSVDVSRFVSTLTAKPQPGRPDPMPPAMRQGTMPSNVPATPTSVAQTFGQNGGRAEFVPLLKEVFKDVKDIFVDNPVELFTKATGGREFSFYRQKGLEEAISKIGEELHSQYMVSYTPNNQNEAGFHEIQVTIAGLNARDVRIRCRPGYWKAAKFQ